MARVLHGALVTIPQALEAAAADGKDGPGSLNIPFSMAVVPDLRRFDYLFPDLQNYSTNLLPVTPQTVGDLKRLGLTMRDRSPRDEMNSAIAAGYTYLGQFIDHDITFEVVVEGMVEIGDPKLKPLPISDIRNGIRNTRSATLDLDSVYEGLAPRDADRMVLGTNTHLNGTGFPDLRPPGKDDRNDLPRKPRQPVEPGDSDEVKHEKIATDREALIGDPRNDENTILSQLHVAFLRAHNTIVDRGHDFTSARRLLRRHYQWLIVRDFLPRIADPAIVAGVAAENKIFRPEDSSFFLPLEFTVAAYRFGHTMVRADYDFNVNFIFSGDGETAPADLGQLFTFTALKGQLGEHDTLPDSWIIQWDHFVDGSENVNRARRFDTKLVEPLFELRDFQGNTLKDEASLAVRNLLRGYLLRMPTGQAVARKLKLTPLTPGQIVAAAADQEQATALVETGFDKKTPLWYYILAEAAHSGGERLGPVGSTLVAEVLIGLVRKSEDSIFAEDSWTPTLGTTEGRFELADLLRLAGVLG